MKMKYALAIDIGASSGRHIVGWSEDGKIQTKEVYRFPNGVTEKDGHLVWDTDALFGYVKSGIAEAKKQFPEIESLSIDTWGVCFVLPTSCQSYNYRHCDNETVVPKMYAYS